MFKLLSNRYISRYLKIFLLTTDLVLLNISYIVALLFKHGDPEILFRQDYKTIWLLANISWITISIGLELYKTVRIHQIEKLINKYLYLIVLHLGFIALLILILKFDNVSRFGIMTFYGLLLSIVLSFQIAFFIFLKVARKKGYNNKRIVLLGPEDSQEEIIHFFGKNLFLGYQVINYSKNQSLNDPNSDSCRKIEHLIQFLENEKINETYICMHYHQTDLIKEIVKVCEDKMVRVKFIPDFRFFTGSKRIAVDFYNHVPVMMLRKEPLQKARFRIIKRLFDICFSFLALLFLIPVVFPIIAIAIKLNSKGPVFYSQLRSGEDHNEFKCYKFRSMSVNNSPNVQASKNDARITKVGAFLRKTSLDELPQFLNVLIGNMSVVGPRPHPLYMSKEYTALVNSYMIRHLAKPGITGWAQVNGFRGETRDITAMQKRVEHDIYYIENWSFLLDLRIIWKTIFNVIKGEETAY